MCFHSTLSVSVLVFVHVTRRGKHNAAIKRGRLFLICTFLIRMQIGICTSNVTLDIFKSNFYNKPG